MELGLFLQAGRNRWAKQIHFPQPRTLQRRVRGLLIRDCGKLQQSWTNVHQAERSRCDSNDILRAFVFGYRTCSNLCLESTVPMLPPPRPFSRRLFLDFCAIFFPGGPHVFGQHESPSNLAEWLAAAWNGQALDAFAGVCVCSGRARLCHIVRSPSTATPSRSEPKRHSLSHPTYQDHGASAASRTRNIDSNMSGTIARVLALHVLCVCVCACACFASICAYLVLVDACVNLFILSDNPYLHACVVLARAICACTHNKIENQVNFDNPKSKLYFVYTLMP